MKILLTIILIFAVIGGLGFAREDAIQGNAPDATNFIGSWIRGSIIIFICIGLPILFVAFIIKLIIG